MQGNDSNSAARASDPESATAGAQHWPEGETLSAWLDGELDAAGSERMVAGLLRDGGGRTRFEAWCFVGDALRSQEVAAGHSPRLCARIRAALEDEPALLAPRALAPAPGEHSPASRRIASGLAIAAAAAVVVFYAVPQLRGTPAATVATSAGAPGAVAVASAAKRNPRFDPYIEAHRDIGGGGVMPASAQYLQYGGEGDR